jgi:hypothetical protein
MKLQGIILVVSCLAYLSSALYEDQVFKFDWKESFVGYVRQAGFHSSFQSSVIVVATEAHVVAGLDADSGAILWRHIQEREELGRIRDLKVNGKHSVSVSGPGELLFVRIWDSASGALVQVSKVTELMHW